MSGFDLAEMLPYYLDETDEQIGVLNDSLMRLETDPADAKALQEAFRVVHSIKGASGMFGFEPVKRLTHQLENYFDQLRGGHRVLDRTSLEACFAALDALRDYHRDLRSSGRSEIDLSAVTERARECFERSDDPPDPEPEPEPEPETEQQPELESPDSPAPASPPPILVADSSHRIGLTVLFAPNLAWRDMKARLVLSRLASRARVLETEPPAETLESTPDLTRFTIWLAADPEHLDELRALADVDGVAEIRLASPEGEPPDTPTTTDSPELDPRSEPIPPPPPPAADELPAGPVAPTRPEPAAEVRAGKPRIVETLRVDLDRLDHLMNLAGELVLNKARFSQIAGNLGEAFEGADDRLLAEDTTDRVEGLLKSLDGLRAAGLSDNTADRWAGQLRRLRENVRAILDQLERVRRGREQYRALAEAIDQLGRVTGGLQKGVLDTRMVPIGPLFERFRRVVRDLSVHSGKDVALRLEGESTELDKRMIDELADPLIHMVRNAVDHGLESPDRREAAGKPRTGTITLQAAHRGNSIVITVGDDGRGINCERLRQKVVTHGLVDPDEAARLNERQLIQFIWHPGLSTAEKVTDVSGRGVGMDIVRDRIEVLNGSVDVRTELGRGTRFTIRLPLTLAILPGLLVRIYEETYAIPLDAVHEIVEVRARELRRVHGRETIKVRGRVLGVVELGDVFRWGGGPHPSDGRSGTSPDDLITVVITRHDEGYLGLRVDGLLGIQEVVLKSIVRNFRSIRGLSGASILGDGRVCLVLDLDALLAMVAESAARPSGAPKALGSAT